MNALTSLSRLLMLPALALMLTTAFAATDPVILVQQTTGQVLQMLEDEPELLQQPERLRAMARELVLPHVDLEAVSRWTLGTHWRQASDDQRRRFAIAFEGALLRTYVTSFNEFQGLRAEYLPVRFSNDDSRANVRTRFHRAAGPPVEAAYSLHLKDGQWKLYDVTVEGLSLTATYRNSFNAEIRRNGLDNLIASLDCKARDDDC